MAFEGMRVKLQSDLENLQSPVHVRALADILAFVLYQNAPVDTGLLQKNLTWTGRPRHDAENTWSAVVGSWGRIGSPEDKAPSGTIAAFLEAHPEYKMGNETKDERRERRLRASERKEAGIGSVFNTWMVDRSRYAWWLLSLEARRVLQQERLAGKFGGESGVGAGRSPYFYVQEGSDLFPGSRDSAEKAGIKPKMFYALSLEQWREKARVYVQAVMQPGFKSFSGMSAYFGSR